MPAPGPADVWECSHLGGDRFAANVVVLPHGFYYGQVPGDGAELVRGARARAGGAAVAARPGRACRRRGRPPSTTPAGELGLLGLDDLPVTRGPAADRARRRGRALGRSRWPARTGRSWRAVESRPSAAADRLTCRATAPGALAHLARRRWSRRLSRARDPGRRSSGIASSVAVSEPW